ncbi:hypothetical protein [Nocardia xishanensis]|uniref:hypothetical protein n=1 Tax=Nocardia xishanensis TaxID=238964 RepID=UPI000829FAB5|nr:hypothetical protein [Nocardia xishanensis]
MSTESERRLPGDGTANESARQTGSESQYDRYGAEAPETGRRQETDAERVGEPAGAPRSAERTADRDVIGADARGTGDAVETGRPAGAAQAPESARAAAEPAASTERVEAGATAGSAAGQSSLLFAEADFDRLRTQWREVQVTFVDDPKTAVARADDLVGDTINKMISTFQQRKRELDERRGDKSDTEDLRQALRGYRTFFDQLLSTGA